MQEELRRVGAALRSSVTRAKVTQATVGPRTILQVTGLDQESFDGVELLLPPGYVALPTDQSDVLLLQVNASRDHKVAIAGDSTTDIVPGLRPGEVGFSRGSQTALLRATGIEMGSPLAVKMGAPCTDVAGNLTAGVGATGCFTSTTGQVMTLRNGVATHILTTQPTDYFDAAYIDNLIARVNAISLCSDLQLLATTALASIQAHITALETQIEALLPLTKLLPLPTDLPSVLTWIGKLAAAQIAPGIQAYYNAVQQLTQLVAKLAELTAAIAAAAARITECQVTIPALTVTPPPVPAPAGP